MEPSSAGDGYFSAVPVSSTAVASWPPPQQVVPAAPEPESRIPAWEALVVTGLVLAASLALQLSMRGESADVLDHALRRGLVVTLFFYLGLGLLVGLYVLLRGVRLTWHRGSPLAAVALGVPVGVGGGALAVAINSGLRGHLSGDPGIEVLVGGGGLLRALVALAVTALMAPLVEETVFRGICAGSFVAKSAAVALGVSALAFAIWHMQPASLRYYALMGLLLGRLWQTRGLIASMTAHAAFNGALTLAALAAVSGSASFATYDAVSFRLPGGWHVADGSPAGTRVWEGSGGASLAINEQPAPAGVTTDVVVEQLRRQERPGAFTVLPSSESVVDVDGVAGVQADIEVGQQPGHVLVVPHGSELYTLVVVTGGSPKGERDWRTVLSTLHVS